MSAALQLVWADALLRLNLCSHGRLSGFLQQLTSSACLRPPAWCPGLQLVASAISKPDGPPETNEMHHLGLAFLRAAYRYSANAFIVAGHL